MRVYPVGASTSNSPPPIAALIQGAVLGCLCYATYDLTNQATLKLWSTKVTVLDILWGTFLTGSASLMGWWATTAILGKN